MREKATGLWLSVNSPSRDETITDDWIKLRTACEVCSHSPNVYRHRNWDVQTGRRIRSRLVGNCRSTLKRSANTCMNCLARWLQGYLPYVESISLSSTYSRAGAGTSTDCRPNCPAGTSGRYQTGLLCERLYQQVETSTSLRLCYFSPLRNVAGACTTLLQVHQCKTVSVTQHPSPNMCIHNTTQKIQAHLECRSGLVFRYLAGCRKSQLATVLQHVQVSKRMIVCPTSTFAKVLIYFRWPV